MGSLTLKAGRAKLGRMAVTEYTFAFFRGEPEPLFMQSLSFADDAEAIREAGEILRAQQDATLPSPATSIGVARGGGDEAEWLGAWDCVDGELTWTPDS